MRMVMYEYDNMKRAGQLLNVLTVSGVDNFRILAEIGDILDSGKIKNYEEGKDGEDET